jgi:hypothetical protein
MTLIQFFVPQPTLINVVTREILVCCSSIGQKVSSTVYGRTVDKDTGKETNKMHLVYSCELELNFSAIKGNLNGINPEIRVQQLWKRFTWLTHTRN